MSNGKEFPLVAGDGDPLVIFEMANNHQGCVEHGRRIAGAMGHIAREHGLNAAVKLQYRDLETFLHPRAVQEAGNKHIKRFLETRLDDDGFRAIIDAIREEGMRVVVTPFDEPSVDRCVAHGVDAIKIASCSADDWPLMETVAQTDKPVIASTGGLPFSKMDNVYNFFTHRSIPLAMLHCVGIYPTPDDLLHLNVIDRMRWRYPGVTVGYSGHEDPDDTMVAAIAVAKGARVLERHVGVPHGDITLNAYSMDPEQTGKWAAAVKTAGRMCGNGADKTVPEAERQSLLALRRGTFSRGPMGKDTPLDRHSIYFAFPCEEGQLTSGQWRRTLRADRRYQADEALFVTREPTLVEHVRDFVHEFKSMFNEAGINIGREFTIELSHHYGLEQFRETGALIVNLVNREYCKKLVAQLPGQRHPTHRHMKKEEVFQVLCGDLTVCLNDVTQTLTTGDLLLIRRGDWHSFTTTGGVIFEEISTQHLPDDSHYQDAAIKAKDPMTRKTVMERW